MKYFFHTTDGKAVRDSEGADFRDDAAAKREAVILFAELLRDAPDAFLADGALQLTVVDASDRCVGEIKATAR